MVRPGPGRTKSSPSVSSRAASTPSSEVPLIRPMTFDISAICAMPRTSSVRVYTMPAAPQFQSEFLRTFVARGAYYDCSSPEELDTLFQKERVTAYIGFDCTAPSLHVVSLVQLMGVGRLQQAGHRPILRMGGGTTKAGDPSGKDETRLLLSAEQIEANKQNILKGVQHLLKFGDGPVD